MKELKIERQKDPTGCGISCVAAIKGWSYDRTKKYIFCKPRIFETEKEDILKALKIKYKRFHNLGSWKRLEKYKEIIAIVGINHRKPDGGWHWVIYQKLKDHKPFILDPHRRIKRQKRAISKKMKPWTYLRIK